MDVPRRQREAIRLANSRAGDDLGRDREVAGHLPDHHHLLRVLLAEVGAVRSDEPEEDRHDGRDAVEVTWAGGALERLRQRTDGDGRIEARWIDLLDARSEHEIDALLGADRQVTRLVARVALEVGRLIELARVHE